MRVVLIDLPPDVDAPDLNAGRPLGPQARVAARIADLLPGATFDADGRGTFRRGNYELAFVLSGDEPFAVDVEIDRPESITALQRVVEKTGWRVIDPDAPGFVDLEASRQAGAIVLVGRPVAPAAIAGDAVARRRPLVTVAGAAVVLAAMWAAWQWTQARPPIRTPESIAGTQEASAKAFAWFAKQMAMRNARMKVLAPAFRDNPIVAQLFDFAIAQNGYWNGLGRGHFGSPERLSDADLWRRFDRDPLLPPTFAQAERTGYVFEYTGSGNCIEDAPGVQECDTFVYSARPLRPGKDIAVTFVLMSEDEKIHIRNDGQIPTKDDPNVDNMSPSTAEEYAAASAASAREPSEGLFAAIGKSVTGLFERFAAPKPTAAAIAAAETSVLRDLRAVAQAEYAMGALTSGTPRYLAPEQLTDTALWAQAKMPPLLAGFFAQPHRQGYEFEFIGDGETGIDGRFEFLKPMWASFVYVARPMDPGPAGRRTFALYPDGQVFATDEHRTPTRSDVPLGDK